MSNVPKYLQTLISSYRKYFNEVYCTPSGNHFKFKWKEPEHYAKAMEIERLLELYEYNTKRLCRDYELITADWKDVQTLLKSQIHRSKALVPYSCQIWAWWTALQSAQKPSQP